MQNHQTPTKIDLHTPLIFNLYKQKDISSYDVIRVLKRSLPKKSYKKIGHFGTLDPFAEGVFLVGFNGALKLNDLMHKFLPKTYLCRGLLGKATDTGDRTGTIIESHDDVANVVKEVFESDLQSFTHGIYWQSPPAYSAAKHEGRNLYEWAREGVKIEKAAKERYVYSLQVVEFSFPYLSLRITVSSGTYIRTLFEDVAKKLGTIGHLTELKRERIGDSLLLSSEKAYAVDDFLLQAIPVELKTVLPFASLQVNEWERQKLRHGGSIKTSQQDCSHCWVLDEYGAYVGLGTAKNAELKLSILFQIIEDLGS